ncbi:BQ2448_618 [Microbotryum intermedium]|uniref:BQ2448_618 protein n=1 Tax=Microbotryum intermedium TaxID=269621 RepID=A0A238F5Z2_9BASI|nr:BQ2448_618 [Microbotryum intermedium]
MRSVLRATRALRQAMPSTTPAPMHIPRTKLTTNVVGLAVHNEPLPTLKHTLEATLSLVQQMPQGAVYRRSVEATTHDRLQVLDKLGGKGSETDLQLVEREIGLGAIEEVMQIAEDEYRLAAKMLEWKAWEELEVTPAKDQWVQFKQTPSTTMPDDLK